MTSPYAAGNRLGFRILRCKQFASNIDSNPLDRGQRPEQGPTGIRGRDVQNVLVRSSVTDSYALAPATISSHKIQNSIPTMVMTAVQRRARIT